MTQPQPGTAPLYPVGLIVAGQRCLVVGGGPVAGRKVCGLVECGADVTMVAPEVHRALEVVAKSGVLDGIDENPIQVHMRPYEAGEAAGYRLVITATGISEIDSAVRHDADAAEIWINSADDPANCSFLLPSVHRDGPVTVAVSTGGASPAMAAWLRRRISELVGSELGTIARMFEQARHTLHSQGRSTENLDWEDLLDGNLPDLVRQGRLAEARLVIDRHLRI